MECTSEGKVATITGQLDRKNSLALTIDEGTYRLDVKKVMEEFSSGDTADQQIPTDPQQLQMLKASGFAYDYYITLPGTVTKQEGGELQNDGSVKFDLIDLPAEAYVESSTAAGLFGFDTTTIIIAVVVVIIAIGAAVIMLKR
jgi:hypothetical protein